MRLEQNYRDVIRRIDAASARAGRPSEKVTLVAVTKSAEPDWIRELIGLGAGDLGESRPQQLVERTEQISGPVRWHLVGHLQRNKARRVLPLVSLIHSVDSLRLLSALERLGDEMNLEPRVLLEVNISGEARKHGFTPDELTAHWDEVLACRHVRIEGLMTMAPLSDDPETSRPVFRGLRELRDRLAAASPPSFTLPHLSMGMSDDFEAAIEEGATIVRIGTSLFEGLTSNA